ncbi:HPr kinase/phosphorylase [Aurantimonas marina]|uniref:HPr kinase/phosphorylase n=1 Tax=Aurantimonas marina TaxID=2780508 RepID=UPI0019CFB6DE|nr:HPr kinase/phosphatase C-terminal domain-containing protein [Aurantimonas marina]
MSQAVNLHGCAITIGGLGILVRGPARSGKSALCLSALRRGASLGLHTRLVADDRVVVARSDAGIVLSAPATLRGLIEVSGIGILHEETVASAVLGLVIDLCDPAVIERLPENGTTAIFDVNVRHARLPARDAAFGADILVSLVMAPLVDDR